MGNAVLSARFAPQGGSWRLRKVDRAAGGSFSGATDLFRIGLNGGGTLASSTMQVIGSPQPLTLSPNPGSQKAAEGFPGAALKIIFRDATATVEVRWQAELRDGSAYLRQTLEIVPLAGPLAVSDVTGLTGSLQAGAISGYTDGAVFTGEGFFAGLETPVAKLFIDPPASTEIGTWAPAAVATGTLLHDLTTNSPGAFELTYQYTSGNHRLDIVRAELLDGETVVSTDEHVGFTGGAASKNVYLLRAPESKAYRVRTTLQQSSGNNSNGKITLTEGEPSLAIGNWTPALVAPKRMTFPVTFPASGRWEILLTYTSGNHRLDVNRVELRNASDQIVAADAHAGYAGIPSSLNTYSLNIPAAGTYTLGIDNVYPASDTNSNGRVTASIASARNLRSTWPRNLTLAPGGVWKTSSVIGLNEPGLGRRSFLHYLERERAHPYRQFVHYNSWYDLNIGRNDNSNPLQRMTESQTLTVVDAWNRELYTNRGVRIDGFVWDDGWDAFNSLWGFHIGFPNGFTVTNQRGINQQAGMGAWLSPWGGYGSSQAQRIASWNASHDPDVFSLHLSDPEYYTAFRDRCLQTLRDYDMRYFKFDGIGAGTFATGPGGGTAADIDGMMHLIDELRVQRPDVFVNCTVGTWASPFWLLTCDSIWRQGYDTGFTGPGNNRERWITYRDQMIWDRFSSSSPLYPLNSLMFHGLVVGNYPGTDPANMPLDLASVTNEIRCSTGCGSGLQELYVTHGLMTAPMWDELAKSLRWVRANADVLSDVHWVGGKPYDSATTATEPYGWAAWNARKGTLTLRNPSPNAASITLTPAAALEMPGGAPVSLAVRAGYADQRVIAGFTGNTVTVSAPVTFALQPFEVLVFDLWPPDSAIPSEALSAAGTVPGTFGAWAAGRGLTVSNAAGSRLAEVFARTEKGSTIPNGIRYIYGIEPGSNQSPLSIRQVDGRQVAELRRATAATADSARARIEGSAGLEVWSLPLADADGLPGKPSDCDWWVPVEQVPQAFFRLKANLK